MDISKTNPVTPVAAETSATDLRASLSRVLNMVVGHSEQASVTQVDSLSLAEKAVLQEQTRAAIIALIKQIKTLNPQLTLPEPDKLTEQNIEKLAIPPAIKADLVKLMQQQQLLQAPRLVTAKLETPQRSFLVFTDQALQKGQQIDLRLTNPNRLSFSFPQPAVTSTPTTSPFMPEQVPNNLQAMAVRLAQLTTQNQITYQLHTSTAEPNAQALGTNQSQTQTADIKLGSNSTPTSPASPSPASPQKSDTTMVIKNPLLTLDLSESTVRVSSKILSAPTTVTSINLPVQPIATPKLNIPSTPVLNEPAEIANTIRYNTLDKSALLQPKPLSQNAADASSMSLSSKAVLSGAASNTNLSASQAYESLANISTKTGYKSTQVESDPTLTHVKESLLSKLPFSELPNPLLSQLNRLLELPAEVRSPILAPTLEQALKRLAERIRTPVELTQPQNIAKAIKQSGIFFENQVSKQLNMPNAHKDVLPNDMKENLMRAFAATLTATPRSNPNPGSLSANPNTLVALSQALSRFVNQLRPASATDEAGEAELENVITELATKSGKPADTQTIKQILSSLVQQHLAQSLTRLQTHQLQSYSQSSETFTERPNAHYQFDIPVRHHNEVQYMQCRLHQDWVDDNNQQTNKQQQASDKTKRWTVTLRFDLPTLGEFAAELKVVKRQVSATLWASRAGTYAKANELLSGLRTQLENEGVEVKQLLCVQGLPKETQPALSYSLIDVST